MTTAAQPLPVAGLSDSETREYRLSRHAREYELEDGQLAVWNAFWPKVTVMSRAARCALNDLPENRAAWPDEALQDLLEARIVYTGAEDPYEQQFFETADRWLTRIDQDAAEFYEQGAVYRHLVLVNSGCNLGCSYCVSYYGDTGRETAKRDALRGRAREAVVMNLVEQFLNRVRNAGPPNKGDEYDCHISFNGGEILLRWDTVKRIMEYADEHYADLKVRYGINTNATLLTPEIAEVLAAHNARVSVSIDGYKELHDESRVYHGGGGTFDRVIDGIENYRKASGQPMSGYQGTIENIDDFDPEKFFRMEDHGFATARLAPNVLDHGENPQRGRDAAHWEAQLVVDSQGHRMGVGATEFERRLDNVAAGKPTGFRANCGGLDGMRTLALTVNMDSMQAGQLCSFSSPATTAIGTDEHRLDHDAVWAGTRRYLAERLNVVKTTCNGCSVVGVCQGGCVYTALDVYNRKNPAGCAYQRALWHHAIDFHETGHVRKLTSSEEDAMSLRVAAAQAAEAGEDKTCLTGSAATSVALTAADGRTIVAALTSRSTDEPLPAKPGDPSRHPVDPQATGTPTVGGRP